MPGLACFCVLEERVASVSNKTRFLYEEKLTNSFSDNPFDIICMLLWPKSSLPVGKVEHFCGPFTDVLKRRKCGTGFVCLIKPRL